MGGEVDQSFAGWEPRNGSGIEDVDAAHLTVMSLKNQGISIAIDDFGAGYSSFHHLAALPFDRIKIDGSFVRMLEKGDDHGKIVAAIVRLGQSLGLPTTGEGVETAECAARLTALGCTTGQGWYFGRPVAAAEVPALIEAINGTATAENAETAAA